MQFLETERIVLEEFRPHEVPLLVDLDSDPEVMKYLNDEGRPSTQQECQEAMGRILDLYKKHNGKFGIWKVIEKSTDEYIGWFLFRPCKTDPENINSIELGYRLKRKFWGKGIATEVSKAFLNLGFENYKLDEIWAKTLLGNLGSQGVMKKAGLKFEREFMELSIPLKDPRAVRYSLKRGDYESR